MTWAMHALDAMDVHHGLRVGPSTQGQCCNKYVGQEGLTYIGSTMHTLMGWVTLRGSTWCSSWH